MEHYSLQKQLVASILLQYKYPLLEQEAESGKWRAKEVNHMLKKAGLLSDCSELLVCLWGNIELISFSSHFLHPFKLPARASNSLFSYFHFRMSLIEVLSPSLPPYLIIAYAVSASVVIQQIFSVSGGEGSDSSWLSMEQERPGTANIVFT